MGNDILRIHLSCKDQNLCTGKANWYTIGSKAVINYGTNTTIKINGEGLKEYFDVVNINYYNAILGTPFLKKFKVTIDFAKDCLAIKDKIILNQADEYKIRERNSQKSTSVNALKTERSDKNMGDSH